MKIGYDYTQPSQTPGGCGWHAHSLLVEMARLAPEAEFLAYRHFAGLFIHPEERLAPLPPLSNIRDPLAGLPFEKVVKTWHEALATHEAPGDPDIVHSLLFQAPAQKKAKLVVTVFDLGFWVHPEFTTEGIRSGCQRGILDALENADGLIFSSDHSRQEFDKLLPSYRRKGKIPSIVTPLGCRYAPISQDTANANAAQHGDYWLFVGSMEPRKNLVGLLNAYESYAENHPAPKPLHFVGGSGWKNEEIRAKLAPLEARGLVKHLGVVADEELPRIYQNAEGFLFPSWYEGFGLPVLEAMSQGCPVICSDRSSLPEVGGEAVLYIDPAKPLTIADAMRRLETEPGLRAKLIHAGLAQSSKFSWERAARQTLAFYEQILAAPSGTGMPQAAAHNAASYKPKAPPPLAMTPQRSFWQKWFPTPKKNQERVDALEAELTVLQQRFTQLESQSARSSALRSLRVNRRPVLLLRSSALRSLKGKQQPCRSHPDLFSPSLKSTSGHSFPHKRSLKRPKNSPVLPSKPLRRPSRLSLMPFTRTLKPTFEAHSNSSASGSPFTCRCLQQRVRPLLRPHPQSPRPLSQAHMRRSSSDSTQTGASSTSARDAASGSSFSRSKACPRWE